MRPDVAVGSLTTGGLVEPRADWTEQARANVLAALRQQQAGRGGKTVIADTRESIQGVDSRLVADLERLHGAVGNSIALHKYLGAELPTKRRGIDWTLGEDAVKLGRATGMDYALFLYAQDSIASGGRVAMQVLGLAGCFVGFLRSAGRRRPDRLCLARRSEDRRRRLVQRAPDQQPASRRDLRRYPHAGGLGADGGALARPHARRPQRSEPIVTGGALTRRAVLGCACCAGLAGVAEARIRPAQMTPLIQAGYRPTETDEKGLWQQYERIERDIAGSNLLIPDKALTSYLGDLVERVGGPAAKDMRVYLAHIPEFNAFMAPTGFMVIFSGLLTRMRDEAQLSGVIAHEAGHFLRRHHVRGWRDLRRKSDAFSILAMGAGVGGAAAGVYLGDAVQLAQFGTIFSLLSYSRELEAEADALGLKLIAEAGYDPLAMSGIWQQLSRSRRPAPACAASACAATPRSSRPTPRRNPAWSTCAPRAAK
jgi:Zn-dependent protease with chaperone function